MSDRKLGVEIECVVPYCGDCSCGGEDDCYDCQHSDDEYNTILRKLQQEGAEITSDGSIEYDSGCERAIEVKCGPKSGAEFEEQVKRVCAILNQYGASVNHSTGLHVHADASEIAPRGEKVIYTRLAMNPLDTIDIATLYGVMPARGSTGEGLTCDHSLIGSRNTYVLPSYPMQRVNQNWRNIKAMTWGALRFLAIAEPLLRALVVTSRRENQYCRTLAKTVKLGGTEPATLSEIYSGIASRYCGINFNSVLDHGTIENRLHSGSTNAQKIIHWARLWARLVDIALDHQQRDIDAIEAVVSDKARREMLFAMLALPKETESYLRVRIGQLASSESNRVAAYIKNKKESICVA